MTASDCYTRARERGVEGGMNEVAGGEGKVPERMRSGGQHAREGRKEKGKNVGKVQ